MWRKPNYFLSMVMLLYNEGYVNGLTVNCTPKCDCDTYQGLRRANCDDGKMLTFIDNVPRKADILEFSFNFVSILDNNVFYDTDLTTLKLLNLSHNHIKDIKVHAFHAMDALKTIDLSNNYLQFLLPEWFWNLPIIEEFYINNNNLGALQDHPKIESDTLKILSLAYCQIPHLQTDLFSGVPNLQRLNLIGNMLVTIKREVIRPLHNLEIINLRENSLNCDLRAIEFGEFCSEHGIEVDEICRNKDENEKMVVSVPKIRKIKKQNAWIVPDDKVAGEVPKIECPESKGDEEKSVLLQVIELSPVLILLATVVVGFVIGLIVGCTVEITPRSVRAPRKRRSRPLGNFDYVGHSLIDYMQEDLESTPMPQRKSQV